DFWLLFSRWKKVTRPKSLRSKPGGTPLTCRSPDGRCAAAGQRGPSNRQKPPAPISAVSRSGDRSYNGGRQGPAGWRAGRGGSITKRKPPALVSAVSRSGDRSYNGGRQGPAGWRAGRGGSITSASHRIPPMAISGNHPGH